MSVSILRNSQFLRKCSGIFRKLPRNYATEAEVKCEKQRKGIILGVYEGDNKEPILTKAAQKFNESTADGKLLELAGICHLKYGETKILHNIDKDIYAVALVGLGHQKLGYNELEVIDEGLEAVRVAAGAGARSLKKEGVTKILVEPMGHPEQAAEGCSLATWRYQENRAKEGQRKIPTIEMYDEGDADSFQRGLFRADSQNFARRIADTPANIMTPIRFAQETINELCPCGVEVNVRDRKWAEIKKLQAFLAVARSSGEPPLVLEIEYRGGDSDDKPILLTGKGITFDTGGMCLKKCDGMDRHRADISGAAVVVAAIKAAAAFSLPINITAVIPVCENMMSGMAMKCGDIIPSLNGKMIEISDTDHEGRLLLADAFVYGQMTYKPKLVIDVATLSNGIRNALGCGASGVFCNTQSLWSEVRKAGIISGDRVWRMPLWKLYTRKVTEYETHDVNNKGHGHGCPCKGAAFLNEFINCVDWIHFDITGVGMKCEDKLYPYLTKDRMTGRPTRTLIQLLHQLSCINKQEKDK